MEAPKSNLRSTLGLIGLAIFLLILFKVVPGHIIEAVYSNGVFVAIRCVLDHSLAVLPLSVGIFILFYLCVRYWRNRRSETWIFHLGALMRCLSILVILFYVLWGYNYKRPGLMSKLNLTAPAPDSTSLEKLFTDQIAILSTLHPKLSHEYDFDEVQAEVRTELKVLLRKHSYRPTCRPRLRRLPPGILLRISTAGVYNPFLGEGYIDVGLHVLQKPFVIGHELSHGYGITDEGEANFWGYLACRQSPNFDIQYSGELGFLRYILSDLRRYAPSRFDKLMQDIPTEIMLDLRSIDRNNNRYPDILPALRDFIYGSYLRSQGVAHGLRSYNDMVSYYMAWDDKY